MKGLKFPDDFVDRLLVGDALKLVKYIPDASVDAVITDPPYGLNKTGIANDADLSVFYSILPELYRVLKADAFFITFFSTKYLPKLFENNPFTYFWQIVLYSPNAAVTSPIGYTKFMSAFVFKKGNPKIVRRKKDLFIDTPGRMVEPDEGFIDHPTPKPKRFIMELLDMFTKEGDLVLDPFVGSGSTAVACVYKNRHFIGIDIETKYIDIARQRIDRARRHKEAGLFPDEVFKKEGKRG